MEFLSITHLKHSGCGPSPTHIKVMNEFKESEETGIKYCKARGWQVSILNCVLRVKSVALFGFEFTALIKHQRQSKGANNYNKIGRASCRERV